MIICLEQGANDLHYGPADATATCHPIVSCFVKIQIGFTFLIPAYPGCPGKEAVKGVSILGPCRYFFSNFLVFMCHISHLY